MQKNLFFRLATIALLVLLLLIPLKLIEDVIGARQTRQSEVEQTIAASSAGPQAVVGPVLAVPYVERVVTKSFDDKKQEKTTVANIAKVALFAPEALAADVSAAVESRYKGIYKALVFETRGKWHARFALPANAGLPVDPGRITPGRAFLAFGVSDVRGILGRPVVAVDGQPLTVQQGTNLAALPQGVHAELGDLDMRSPRGIEVEFDTAIIGTTTLAFAPVGGSMTLRLKSLWPHPNFTGRFLPRERTVSADGFSARWETSQFSTTNAELLRQGVALQPDGRYDTFGVTFIEPLNIFQRAERAVKYGILFVALTFAGLFLLEVLARLRIHPLQYLLVGLALAMFFLLVISLSEHIAFGRSYLAAAAACVALLGFYLAHVLHSLRRGVAFAALFTMLYGVLYALLLSEDNALVLGSLLLFAALAVIMVLTRRVDWYALRTDSGAPRAAAPRP